MNLLEAARKLATVFNASLLKHENLLWNGVLYQPSNVPAANGETLYLNVTSAKNGKQIAIRIDLFRTQETIEVEGIFLTCEGFDTIAVFLRGRRFDSVEISERVLTPLLESSIRNLAEYHALTDRERIFYVLSSIS